MSITRTQPGRCRVCFYKADALGNAAESEHNLPKPGDIAICMSCGTISIIEDDMDLRPMTESEIEEISTEEVEAYQILLEASENVKKRIQQN